MNEQQPKPPLADEQEHLRTLEVIETPEENFSLLTMGDEKQLATALTQIENAFKFLDKVRDFVLQRSRPNDWTNQNGNPYLGESGTNRFWGPFKIYEKNIKAVSIDKNGQQKEDTNPGFFNTEVKLFMISGIIGSELLNVEGTFEGGSILEDGFRSKDDVLFYFKKAKANWRGRALRKLLGLENLTWEDLKKVGITEDNVRKVERLSTLKAETEESKELWNYLLELNEGDAKKAEDYLFNFTTSEKYQGKRKPSQLTAAQMKWVLPKIKSDWAKKFPDKAKTSSNQSHTDSHDSFASSIAALRPKVTDEKYAELLQSFNTDDPLKLTNGNRNKFLIELGKIANGGQK
jgi:hypothetical protein